jgi:hypothetical protein
MYFLFPIFLRSRHINFGVNFYHSWSEQGLSNLTNANMKERVVYGLDSVFNPPIVRHFVDLF